MSLVINDVLLDGKKTDILIDGNLIKSIGGKLKADKVINGSGKMAIPGLINTHTHAAMTLFRGYGDDMLLHKWLEEKIWPAEAKLNENDVYWGTKLACLEMIKTGTTTFNDQYWYMKGTARAVDEMGLRAVLSEAFFDLSDEEKAKKSKKTTKCFIDYIKEKDNERITAALGPHSVYTVSSDSFKWVADYSNEKDLLIHFHLSETEKENSDCEKTNGKRPVEYLQDIGFLSDKVVAAHCVWINKKEMNILSEHVVKIAHNPVSNMKLSVGGFIDYSEMKDSGLVISLGTDGCASNNNLDMFEEMKFAAVAQKGFKDDPTSLPAKDALNIATQGGAAALQINAGIIEEGKLADIVLIDLKTPELIPKHNLISNLVYSANGSCVDTVICNGKVLMENRKVEDEEQIIEKTNDVALDLVSRT